MFLEIAFPLRVERVGGGPDFPVPPYRRAGDVVQRQKFGLSCAGRAAGFDAEDPVIRANDPEILRPDPPSVLSRMPSPCPAPQTLPNRVTDVAEDTFRYDMPVIVGPSLNERIEFPDQPVLPRRRVVLHNVPQLAQEALNARSGRLNQQRSCRGNRTHRQCV